MRMYRYNMCTFNWLPKNKHESYAEGRWDGGEVGGRGGGRRRGGDRREGWG